MATKQTPEQLISNDIALMQARRASKDLRSERIEYGVWEGGIKLAIARRLAPEQAKQEHDLVLERAAIVSKMTPTAKRRLNDAMAVLAGVKATPEKDDESEPKTTTRRTKASKSVLDTVLTANDSGSVK